jgi:hypothetical protein
MFDESFLALHRRRLLWSQVGLHRDHRGYGSGQLGRYLGEFVAAESLSASSTRIATRVRASRLQVWIAVAIGVYEELSNCNPIRNGERRICPFVGKEIPKLEIFFPPILLAI